MDNHSVAAGPAPKSPKSPPLAFQTTSNDALACPTVAAMNLPNPFGYDNYSPNTNMSPSPTSRRKLGSAHRETNHLASELQALMEKQSEALRLQQIGFAAERECWDMERDRLYRRVASLEALLKSANGHSPAKSPIVSPGANHTPPTLPRSSNASSRLPSIAEHEGNTSGAPLPDKRVTTLKRDSAPSRIEIPTVMPTIPPAPVVPYADGPFDELSVQVEQPPSPPGTRNALSPPPAANRHLAGHTPIKISNRPPELSSSARSSRSFLPDTPTRSNTEHNLSLSQDDGASDEDRPLSGPLHMPELPETPGEECFTMMMLDARLREIEEHPEDHQPLVLQDQNVHPLLPQPDGTAEVAPTQEIASAIAGALDGHAEKVPTSNGRSPPPVGQLEPGGIKLKKKISTNFGAPLGQLGTRSDNFRRF